MTADLEAVTRALAEHRRDDDGCNCDHWEYTASLDTQTQHEAHLAAVLASLPDDRLAEAEAKVRRVEKHMAFRERLGSDSSPHYEIRAALSGGDAP